MGPASHMQVVNGFNSTVFAYGQTSSGKVSSDAQRQEAVAVLMALPCTTSGRLERGLPWHDCCPCGAHRVPAPLQTHTMKGTASEPGIIPLAVQVRLTAGWGG